MRFSIKYLNQYKYRRNPWLVKRVGKSGKHTHVATKEVAEDLISIINNGYIPISDYLRESAYKLLTEEEFAKLRPYRKKQKYCNRGGRKVG